MNGSRCCLPFVVALSLALSDPAIGDPLNDWIEGVREEAVMEAMEEAGARRNLDQRVDARQVDASTSSSNTTTLVDQSSAADLLSVALNLSGLSGQVDGDQDDESDATSVSVSSSAYALRALLETRDPLDPEFYCAEGNEAWRDVSFTLGYDKQESSNQPDVSDNVTILGLKWRLINERDACKPDPELWGELAAALTDAATVDATIVDRLLEHIAETEGDERIDNLLVAADSGDGSAVGAALEPHREWLSAQYTVDAAAFTRARLAAAAVAEELSQRPQVSLAAGARLSDGGTDMYDAKLIFDVGFTPRWSLTGNAAFEYSAPRETHDRYGGSVAAALRYELGFSADTRAGVDPLFRGRDPIETTLGVEGSVATDRDPIYKGQLKIVLPLFEGVNLPISITAANRTELIDEDEIRGQVGFSVDTSRLLGTARGPF